VSPEKSNHKNRLQYEKSPYLLQHADNPVNWYPWGKEALEKSRSEDKPIFLSIGYSTCHWCHVMEHESFENAEIADFLNEHFVSIKVDREERPDLDKVYMDAVVAMTGSGGWPMTLFLTPELKPFFGGTYFPPDNRYGRPGFLSILEQLQKGWVEKKEEIIRSSQNILDQINSRQPTGTNKSEDFSKEILTIAFDQFAAQFDGTHGGFGGAPKFPTSHNLSFLLRYAKGTGNKAALEIVEKTLIEMARGGMYDQLGGGFHRYSTDPYWHVPHFEKMLYDQAILSKTYLEAYQVTGNPLYSSVAREVFRYCLNDMRDPLGGFYSAEDADSASDPLKPDHKTEGAFYVWRTDEVRELLDAESANIAIAFFGMVAGGNAPQDPHGDFKNLNILIVKSSVQAVAKEFKKSEDEIRHILKHVRQTLLKARDKRLRPHLDDKVLTDWNGLMISSLALGSRIFNDTTYLEAAEKAADFILEKMVRRDGRLLHRYREGEAGIPAFLEDYAFFVHGLIDLYEASFNAKYLERAIFFTREMIRLFWDEGEGGFFLTADDGEKLILRPKDLYDGAIPSGNAVAALDLIRLNRLTAEGDFTQKVEEMIQFALPTVKRHPSGHGQMLWMFDFYFGPSKEIVLAGDRESEKIEQFLSLIYGKFLPNKVVLLHPSNAGEAAAIEALAPFIKEQVAEGSEPLAFVCQNFVCQFPTGDLTQLEKLLTS